MLIVLTVSFASSQAQPLFTIDSVQLSNANQNFVYAKGCKEVKDGLFSALDTAVSIIEDQKAELAAKDSVIAIKDEKYQLCEESEATARKQAKKERNKKTANAVLFYVSLGLNAALVIIYVAK